VHPTVRIWYALLRDSTAMAQINEIPVDTFPHSVVKYSLNSSESCPQIISLDKMFEFCFNNIPFRYFSPPYTTVSSVDPPFCKVTLTSSKTGQTMTVFLISDTNHVTANG
jgi:hypothetical protein